MDQTPGKSPYREGTWEPKYPEFAEQRTGPIDQDIIENDQAEKARQWTYAPTDSHVYRFRYIDTRIDRFQRKFIGVSHLIVQFKAKGRWPITQYTYSFRDAQHGQEIYELMAVSEHPGSVVYHSLIQGKVPYTKDSGANVSIPRREPAPAFTPKLQNWVDQKKVVDDTIDRLLGRED